MLLFLTFISVFVIFIYYTVVKPLNHFKNKNIPYYNPSYWSIFSNFILISRPFTDVLNDIYNLTCGRFVGFFFFLKPVLMVTDIDLIKKITVKDFDHFVDHRSFVPDDVDKLFGRNLFSLKGQQWRKMRATLSPAFTGSKMRAMFVLMSEIAEQFTNHFLKEVGPNETLSIELKDTFTRTANDIIASTAFGINCDSFTKKDNDFYLNGKDLTDFSGLRGLKFFLYDISPTLMRLLKIKTFAEDTANFFKNIVVNNIAMREEKGIIRPDMIHLLMEARKGLLKHEENAEKYDDTGFATVEESKIGKSNQDGQLVLDDDEVTAQALIFFFAGFDTISTALSHTTYELALNEDVQRKLQNEIDAAWKECNNKPTYETINGLKYLDMVISEGIRLWPPAPMLDRVCTIPYTIESESPNEIPVHLENGNVIFIPVFSIHRDPKYYPNPNKFDPERFSDENKDNIKPFTYMPFGLGPRNCIGSRFALLEAKTILFYLLRKFNLVVTNKTQIPLKISRKDFSMNAEKGFWLGLKRRQT